MPIHSPGQKFRNSAILTRRGAKREVVAILSLTAMVDMFTVLVIFLLQNYNSTGMVIYIPKEVTLPKAAKIKDLVPSVVVTISNVEVLVDKSPVISYSDLKAQEDWMIKSLSLKVQEAIAISKQNYDKKIQNQIKTVVDAGKDAKKDAKKDTPWNKVTIQADKGMDFLSVKKVMYTVIESGAGEVNFAVNKDSVVPGK